MGTELAFKFIDFFINFCKLTNKKISLIQKCKPCLCFKELRHGIFKSIRNLLIVDHESQ